MLLPRHLHCTVDKSNGYDFVESHFPQKFIEVGYSLEELGEMQRNNACNVIAALRSSLLLQYVLPSNNTGDEEFVLGDKLMMKDPLAAVTRNNDPEFSDVVDWVINALFYGEEQGLIANSSLCQNYTNSTVDAPDLRFMNAVYCVGNYRNIVFGKDWINHGMNYINVNGSTRMLFATPFGKLDGVEDLETDDVISNTTFHKIRTSEMLNCGVMVSGDPDEEVKQSSKKLPGLSEEYYRTLSAALFSGPYQVKISKYAEIDEGFSALSNGTIDILLA